MTGRRLEAEGLSFRYGDGFALEKMSFRVAGGECAALLGANGAGKSTLLKLLAGILPASGGAIRWAGETLDRRSPRAWAAGVAWVPQEMDLPFAVPVEDLIRTGFFPRSGRWGWLAPERSAARLEHLISRFGLGALRRRDARTLSGGERRRALLARGLAQGAGVLLLDEPAAHLDPARQRELCEAVAALREEGVAVVAALHDVNLALELADRALLLAGGGLLAEGPAGDVLTPALLERAYGLPAERVETPGGPFIRFPQQPKEVHP